MTSMPQRFAMIAATVLIGIAGGLVARSAQAGVLYRCEGPNGAIAYTNKTSAFTKCVELSRYADVAPSKPAAHAVVARAKPAINSPAKTIVDAGASDAPKTPASASGWSYRENVNEKPDVKATASGVATTAQPLRATSFGVESTATLVQSATRNVPPTPEAAPSLPVSAMLAKADPPPALSTEKPAPKVLRGAVYRVQRNDGITEYTNVKPAGSAAFAVLFTYIATCIACDVHSKIDFAHTPLNVEAFKTEIAAAAASYGVDSALLRAVIHAESAFNPLAVSIKGAQGLMQLMPSTAGDLGVSDAFDVAQNIGGGAKYLAQLLKDFNGNTELATAAYNAGEGAVQKYGGVPPYDETRVYVQRVAQLRDRYQKGL
jgi:soluble lytic murein transglycosylase-like protein